MYKILFFIITIFISSNLLGSSLKSDEHVMFMPDIAYLNEDNELIANVQAWVYEKERRPGFTTLLAKYMNVDKSKLNDDEYERLYQKSALFRVDSENNKEFKIKFENNQIFDMPTTQNGGRSTLIANIKTDIVDIYKNNKITFSVYNSGNPATADIGVSYFYLPHGISVISDIDDTIKDSNVLDKKELLKNTFLYEFKAINIMNELFWNINHENNSSVAFHYVSSSPIQLYPAIKEFLENNNFPQGSVHLREMTGWDNILFAQSKEHKLNSIEKILKAYPKRKFILVGDSGESDPEIYSQISTKYKEQIINVLIRNVTNEDKSSQRYNELFGGFNEDFLQIID